MNSEPGEALLNSFWRTLTRAPRRILLLDYDGTLAPFQTERDKACPYPEVTRLLTSIQNEPSCRLVIISGRAVDDLLPLLGMDPPPEIWGSHGLERRISNGRRELHPIDQSAMVALEQAALWIEQKGLTEHCEQKPGCMALHWRGLTPEREARIRRNAEADWPEIAAEGKLYIHLFDGGIELRHPGRTKGDAVRTIIKEEEDAAAVAYLGDDATDEEAFRAVKARGLGILIRPERRPTAAQIWLRPPDDLIAFLRKWCMICKDRPDLPNEHNDVGGLK
ncbi:MAG: trehalose-phosphatase [Candidatus Eisenbacteria bacterium]|uniref:Trehalose 6-phosphate phosphatase n=1 Tax=Eiseniibacteriota bacterium TaxID=2212470 RepID=A0A948RXH6_UNCEI|nr:trehalose-phosphatase [Candidatus Eisenbacteria bacterium]MBU1948182.1 trehalose-phosphatase [Candidatus Eisenbacteria bacterium]MBU2692301.1 trehalose-phosphatase [Candidatus Eisenbacteria bacterium]